MFGGVKFLWKRLDERGVLLHDLVSYLGDYGQVEVHAIQVGEAVRDINVQYSNHMIDIVCHTAKLPLVRWKAPKQCLKVSVALNAPGFLVYSQHVSKIVCYIVHDESREIAEEARTILEANRSRYTVTYPA